MIEIRTNSEEETYLFAKQFAESLKDGDIVCLNGDLGAGKTVFVRGISSYFGIEDISSPTFTIVNEYKGTKDINHFDVYRLSNEDEFYDCGLDEYFGEGICIIEWSDIIKDALPSEYIDVRIQKIDEDERNIIIEKIGERMD